MAKQYPKLQPLHHAFIARQGIFFTATAASAGRVNISSRAPTRYVLSEKAIAYLDRTGSGNETAAHLRCAGRMTIVLCAFDRVPLIQARVIRRNSAPPTVIARFLSGPARKRIGDEITGRDGQRNPIRKSARH